MFTIFDFKYNCKKVVNFVSIFLIPLPLHQKITFNFVQNNYIFTKTNISFIFELNSNI
jgi:hypothetical protein